jgi:hypothetical protein
MTTDTKHNLFAAELPLEVPCERIDPDALDGLSVAMQYVEFATALGVAKVSPVGGFVAGAGKARFLDEGFEQEGPIGVAGLPVIGQGRAEDPRDINGRGEALHAVPGIPMRARVR